MHLYNTNMNHLQYTRATNDMMAIPMIYYDLTLCRRSTRCSTNLLNLMSARVKTNLSAMLHDLRSGSNHTHHHHFIHIVNRPQSVDGVLLPSVARRTRALEDGEPTTRRPLHSYSTAHT